MVVGGIAQNPAKVDRIGGDGSRLSLGEALAASLGSILVEVSLAHNAVVAGLGRFGDVVDTLDSELCDLPVEVCEAAEGDEDGLLGLVLAEAVDDDNLGRDVVGNHGALERLHGVGG